MKTEKCADQTWLVLIHGKDYGKPLFSSGLEKAAAAACM